MQFLRSKLTVVCARGFEIMNLDTLLPGTIPDFTRCSREDPRILALARRVEIAKPLGMFKLASGDFLLCFDAFACYVDRSGEPLRLDSVVEWEGTPQSVAYSSPFILGFDHRFVEIRDASTGRLVQIIRGNDVRHVSAASVVEGSDASDGIIMVHRQRIGQGQKSYDRQVVFELIQTSPQMRPSDLTRKDTSTTFSSGMLSHSATMSSTRSANSSAGLSSSTGRGTRGHLRQQPSQIALAEVPDRAGWI